MRSETSGGTRGSRPRTQGSARRRDRGGRVGREHGSGRWWRGGRERGSLAIGVVVALVVVVLVLGLAAVAGFFVLMPAGREIGPAQGPIVEVEADEQADDHRLTDQEAIARFKELDALRIEALEQRNTSLLGEAFTKSGPAEQRLARAIRRLKADRAFADEQLEVLHQSVLSNTPRRIVIKQVALLDIKFRDKQGNDITEQGGLERQVIEWTMRPVQGTWLLHDGLIRAARPVSRT